MNKTMILFCLFACCLSACSAMTTIGENMIAYQKNFDNYVREHGAPTSQYTLQTGDTLYTFIRPCSNSQGYEENQITVDPNNQIIKRENKHSCPIN